MLYRCGETQREMDSEGTRGDRESLPPSVQSVSLPVHASGSGERCGCGCVPNIRSLFEMAELRAQYRRKAALERVEKEGEAGDVK